MASEKLIKQWVKDRDEAVLSFDLEKFKAFYRKYQALGVYKGEMPSDRIMAVAQRKMVLQIESATEGQKFEAKNWLFKRGYDFRID
jgi:hypothetical protein